jgi:Predicted subunit of the Multisubunit Na+/H+ antiporter
MDYIEIALLILLVVCGVCTCVTKNLLVSLIIFMAYSVLMSIIWALLEAPDLAITEAAVGAGVSSILMFLTLKKLRDLKRKAEKDEETEI